MFFYVSKIISALIWPSNVITMLMVAGLALLLVAGNARPWALPWARRLLAAGATAYLVLGYSPLGQWLVLPLEERFARPALPAGVAGIVILGGFESASVGQARGELSLTEAAERLTEALLVAKARPQARVVFTGGDGSLLLGGGSAAGDVGRFLEAMGIERARIVLEAQSRTTFENAVYTRRLVDPRPGETWVLVTSAFHMPRAMGTFRQAGFDVVPWPSDFRTRGQADRWVFFNSSPAGLERVDLAFKEWIGLVAYRLSGRSSALWPGPGSGSPGPVPGPEQPPKAGPAMPPEPVRDLQARPAPQ